MSVSLCITVFNEEHDIQRLLESISEQTKQPDEIVIVDGGSTDATVSLLKQYAVKLTQVRVLEKKGNRPMGRNESIKQAKGDIIAITDAGCELDKRWLEEITKPFSDPKTYVVSGYYAGKPTNGLEEALVPYVLVMPDKINPSHFLPATRSMAMRKKVWEELGGFPQEYRWNEDYVFSKRIEKKGIPIVFAQKAIVYWFPRGSLVEGWKMFYAFAKGDAQAGIWRKKVVFLLVRGVFIVVLLSAAVVTKSVALLSLFVVLAVVYLLWAVGKNARYIKRTSGYLFLPIWQIVSDKAVFIGTLVGFFDRLTKKIN